MMAIVLCSTGGLVLCFGATDHGGGDNNAVRVTNENISESVDDTVEIV